MAFWTFPAVLRIIITTVLAVQSPWKAVELVTSPEELSTHAQIRAADLRSGLHLLQRHVKVCFKDPPKILITVCMVNWIVLSLFTTDKANNLFISNIYNYKMSALIITMLVILQKVKM